MFLTLLFTFTYGQLSAQNKTITGKVTSKDDGTGIPGATVRVKNGTVGSQTDVEGKYKLEVPTDAKQLEISFIGMATKVVEIGNQSEINIVLLTEDTDLNEVIVVGYSAQQKREVTGAVSSVKGTVIENLPVQSFDRALQGRAAGVVVSGANGVPGGAVSVRIRGVGSITAGNDPLYIVDGVQMNTGSANSTSTNASNNPLAFLNPNDIESMDVIKDAAAAAIYGSQAANGVVIITTKKGKAGDTKFGFNYYKGINEPLNNLAVTNSQQYLQSRFEAVQNSNPTLSPETVWTRILGQSRLDVTLTEAQRAALPTYDWQKEAFRTGNLDNYELTASGGNDKTTFYVSGAYQQQDASLRNVDMKRFTTRLSVTHKMTDRLILENSINLSSTTQRGTFGNINGGSFLGSPQFAAPLILPFNRIYNEDGSFFGLPADGGLAGSLNQNVIMTSDLNTIKNTTNQAVGNIRLNYKVMKGLTATAFAGVDFRYFKGVYVADPRTADGFNVSGRISDEAGQNINFINNYTLNYDKTLNDVHHITGLLGAEYRSDFSENISATGQGVPNYKFIFNNSAATPNAVGGLATGYKNAGVFGNIKYAYNKKYFLSVILRYDGSSRFGSESQYGIFPGISAGWTISEESFVKNIAAISQLKLRASYGQTGNNQIGNFDSRGTFSAASGTGTAVPGGTLTYGGVAGIGPNNLGNSSLSWEKNSTINLGIDYALFNGRISGAVDIYQRTNTDLLLGRAVPHTSGYGNISSNVGEMVNKGLEVEVTTVNVKYKTFTWKTSFNIALIANKVTKLNEADTVLPGDVSVRLNQPINSNFAARYAGVNPATGKGMWYDRNGNITYLPNNPNDFIVLGNDLSTTTGGLTNSFSYKGLELEVFFQYDFGRQALNSQNAFATRNGGSQFNTLLEPYLRRWQKPGDITDVPRPIDGNTEIRSVGATTGSRFYEDASYIRLKQITLSYMLPTTLVKKAKLTSVRFYATAINLLTFTKWGGVDPEFVSQVNPGVANTVANRNNNTGVVPQSRNYTIGVQIGF